MRQLQPIDGLMVLAMASGAGLGLLLPGLLMRGWLWLCLPCALLVTCRAAQWRLPALLLLGLALAQLHAAHVLDRQWPAARNGQTLTLSGQIIGLVE